MLSKRCPKCEEVLVASFFNFDKRAKGGQSLQPSNA